MDPSSRDRAPVAPESPERPRHGTWWQRALVLGFGLAFALLCYWTLGFVLQDIGRLEGPRWDEFVAERVDPRLRDTAQSLAAAMDGVKREIETEERRRQLLRESTGTSQKTLGQLLDLQRNLQEAAPLPEEQQWAFAEAQQLFIDNQRREQTLNETLAALQERRSGLDDAVRENAAATERAERPLREEFTALSWRHRLRVAGFKIAFLTPLLVVSGLLFARSRGSGYAPLVYAAGGAVLVKTFMVMHEYFPAEYFRYILVGAALAVVGWLLVKLLGMVARPSSDARQKQYREAYEGFRCPVCEFPIRRGPLQYMAWTPRSLRKTSRPVSGATDEPYVCPACATPLFVACGGCSRVRHALLPACEHCGAREPVA